MTLLITFDGPKGVGKSTLIKHVDARLAELGHFVEALSEKELMAAQASGSALTEGYAALKSSPGRASEAAIAALHLQGRLLIQETFLRESTAEVLLLDRWYPSDAVFRRHIDVAAVIQSNLDAGVRVPDLALAVSCDPEVSWERALSRARRLDSKVIENFNEHAVSTTRFEDMARRFGWSLLRTECSTPDVLCNEVVAAIEQVMRRLR